ncbi:MAG: hypothetical protein LBU27_08805 [Candidatus Peribacteria bacterium]|jgi:hypothetical protein|nr:hypothetical protein [Candidatus Peribacteria bacterium]
MYEDYLCDSAKVINRNGTEYVNGLSQPKYEEKSITQCRVSSLNWKDFQFLDKIKETSIGVAKLHTLTSSDIKIGDRVEINGKHYEVFQSYEVKGQETIHHKKFYIKIIEQ